MSKKRKKKPPKPRALRFQDMVVILAGLATIIGLILDLIDSIG